MPVFAVSIFNFLIFICPLDSHFDFWLYCPISGQSYDTCANLPGSGFGSPVTARRSRLAALAARGVAEDFSTFQVSFGAPPRPLETSPSQKPAVTFPTVVIPFPKPAATFRPATVPWRQVTVHLPKVAAHGRKGAAPFGKVTVPFHPGTAAFQLFSAKTPCFWQNPRFLPVWGWFPAGPPATSRFLTFRKSTVL